MHSLWLQLGHTTDHRELPAVGRGLTARAVPAALAAFLVLFFYCHDWRSDYVARPGEQRAIQLGDGTRVELNSDSALDIRIAASIRLATLVRGEAFFQVVHEPRPFIVEAAKVRVRDLGTAFSVRRDATNLVQVTVDRGEVEISGSGSPVRVGAGTATTIDRGSVSGPYQTDPAIDLAWRQGRLILVNQTLGDVAAELNRYRPGLIFITNPAKSALRINGVLSLDHIDAWLQALPQAEPIELVKVGPIVWIR